MLEKAEICSILFLTVKRLPSPGTSHIGDFEKKILEVFIIAVRPCKLMDGSIVIGRCPAMGSQCTTQIGSEASVAKKNLAILTVIFTKKNTKLNQIISRSYMT